MAAPRSAHRYRREQIATEWGRQEEEDEEDFRGKSADVDPETGRRERGGPVAVRMVRNAAEITLCSPLAVVCVGYARVRKRLITLPDLCMLWIPTAGQDPEEHSVRGN